MPIAIFDPFSGISGDMTLGALLDVGLSPDWLRALPATLGLQDIGVRIRDVRRGEIACRKVDFDIPPQPHGRGIREIRALVAAAPVPDRVRALADECFTAIASCEAEIHGMDPADVHLHEVGAVDAILDVVGSIWGFHLLGVTEAFTGRVALGDGSVRAAHGVLPVPAPATLKLLEGIAVKPGPEGAGELVTPTGAALLRVMTRGRPAPAYVPARSGFGAGSKDFPDRANALRLILAEHADDATAGVRELVLLSADVDDMTAEHLAAAADDLRAAGALDVTLVPVVMKKGRAGTRVDVLAEPATADALETRMLTDTTTIGVRRASVRRRALARELIEVDVLGHTVGVKIVTRPDGSRTAKPEHDHVVRVAHATGNPVPAIFRAAEQAAERALAQRV
ncbi:MAG: nickel pincer cofactor biosynthesis protein LarC [Gemmatimonadaceae bacterium]|nr:nickel pincer cofactor biosynthesis protein LarC [Gemmatimonadaceae bacterium]NUQ94029.1 nickel pincer cofactor biosynthesis protein LarC [Gemmatimonadaceae bacterium]NUR19918.1 nickel pincer cofactor biosynthesis protein LarC [Gemmatimonadaceae bacterium]NUS96285.1 nickel pincer cofactor biosynthesis protein LarC [Gemmatimonadaceae bacterium]